MASLTIVTGPNEGDFYPLGKRPMVVGRDEACPIQIVDELVSRKHVQIRCDESKGAFFALDMKSANGVLVNGRKIEQEIELTDGDEIEVGKSKLMFSDKDFPDRSSALAHWHERGQRRRSTIVREN